MVNISFTTYEVRILSALIDDLDAENTFLKIHNFELMNILIKLYKAEKPVGKAAMKVSIQRLFKKAKMKYERFYPSFLKPQVKK